jgi:hypothetical protein
VMSGKAAERQHVVSDPENPYWAGNRITSEEQPEVHRVDSGALCAKGPAVTTSAAAGGSPHPPGPPPGAAERADTGMPLELLELVRRTASRTGKGHVVPGRARALGGRARAQDRRTGRRER